MLGSIRRSTTQPVVKVHYSGINRTPRVFPSPRKTGTEPRGTCTYLLQTSLYISRFSSLLPYAFSSQCDQVGQVLMTYSCFCSLETPSLFHFFASFSSAFLSVLDCCFHSLLIAH